MQAAPKAAPTAVQTRPDDVCTVQIFVHILSTCGTGKLDVDLTTLVCCGVVTEMNMIQPSTTSYMHTVLTQIKACIQQVLQINCLGSCTGILVSDKDHTSRMRRTLGRGGGGLAQSVRVSVYLNAGIAEKRGKETRGRQWFSDGNHPDMDVTYSASLGGW